MISIMTINRSSKDAAKDRRLYLTYGITLSEWEQRLKKQHGVCSICKDRPGKGVLCVDHLHIKGFKGMPPEKKRKYVRGLLCFMCNTALKGFEKTTDAKRNRQMLEGTYAYFKEFSLKGELNENS